MLLFGMSIVKVISSPDIVPMKTPGVRPAMPAKFMTPVIVDPLCVSGHVMLPMPVWPITLFAPIEMLESEALPVHVPVIEVEAIGPDGDVGELPPHAVTKLVSSNTASICFIWSPFNLDGVADGRSNTPASRRSRFVHKHRVIREVVSNQC